MATTPKKKVPALAKVGSEKGYSAVLPSIGIDKGLRDLTAQGTAQMDNARAKLNRDIMFSKPIGLQTYTPPEKPSIWGKVGEVASDIVPYISNLRAAFQKPPMPAVPELNSPVTLQKYNMDKARNDIRDESRAANIGIGDRMRGNVGEAARANTLVTKLRALSDVSDREAQANVGIANQQAQLNKNIEMGNVSTRNQYQESLVERQMAHQSAQQENIANAADKFMAQQNVKQANKLERAKMGMYSTMFNQGLVGRNVANAAKAAGMTEEEYRRAINFGGYGKYGGKMRSIC